MPQTNAQKLAFGHSFHAARDSTRSRQKSYFIERQFPRIVRAAIAESFAPMHNRIRAMIMFSSCMRGPSFHRHCHVARPLRATTINGSFPNLPSPEHQRQRSLSNLLRHTSPKSGENLPLMNSRKLPGQILKRPGPAPAPPIYLPTSSPSHP
jgi:hypothetical protein